MGSSSSNDARDPALPAYCDPSTLPERAAHPATVEHVYSVRDKRSRPWLTLKIRSRAASASKLPCIIEGEPVVGSVVLDLGEDTKIKSVTVMVIGEMGLSAHRMFRFVTVAKKLWSHDMGYPSAADVCSAGRPSDTLKGKLNGDFVFPFSLDLPSTVSLNRDASDAYRLPGSVRTYRVTINYSICAMVIRGMFSTEHMVSTGAGYAPYIRPASPSVMRQLAYFEHTPVPGPQIDPEGWYTLPPVSVYGTVFDTRQVQIEYTLSLAKPLTYTRGTSIPVSLRIMCLDPQALDLLSSPKAPSLLLQRVLSVQYDPEVTEVNSKQDADTHFVGDLRTVTARSLIEDEAMAAWWSDESFVMESSTTRGLQGEIHLKPSTYPSSHLGYFQLLYIVVLYPRSIPGFTPSEDAKTPLLRTPVEIGTIHTQGPRAIKYSDPVDIPYDCRDGAAA